jgi:cytosine/adenosine deaminase-related metal-dependent hydrolase
MVQVILAKYVLAEPSRIIENGGVSIDGGKITGVGTKDEVMRTDPAADVTAFGDCVLMPGFVNAHTHLELTDMRGKIAPTKDFVDWIKSSVMRRLLVTDKVRLKAIRAGAAECLVSGITTLADYSKAGGLGLTMGAKPSLAPQALQEANIRRVIFEEILNPDPTAVDAGVADFQARLKAQGPPADLSTPGLAPHAPYSVSSELYLKAAATCAERGIPFSTHCSELVEEAEFVRTGEGRFKDLLTLLKRRMPVFPEPRGTPVAYLAGLGILKLKPVLVHCNYLSASDIEMIAQSGSSAVYCPGSHRYFSHPKHPLPELLKAGVNVALGTDSLNSNSELNMFREMRIVREEFPGIAAETLVGMATQNGACALGLGAKTGRLATGFFADVIAIRLDAGVTSGGLCEAIAGSTPAKVVLRLVGGSEAKVPF